MREVKLKELDRWEVDDKLARLDLLEAQIDELAREIWQRGKVDEVTQRVTRRLGSAARCWPSSAALRPELRSRIGWAQFHSHFTIVPLSTS
jgi:hypothetical protein